MATEAPAASPEPAATAAPTTSDGAVVPAASTGSGGGASGAGAASSSAPAGAAAAATPAAASGAAAASSSSGPAAGGAQEQDTASRTFFTAIDAEAAPKKGKDNKKDKYEKLQETNAGPRITEFHKDLVTLANSLDHRMAALLKEHEKDFFLAYKTHMYTVQKDIKTLKLKADHEEAKTREDTKIKNLEGELDWFMTEALRLDELCKGYKKEVDKWKAKAEALDEDRRFLEDQIKGAKRQNKILRAAAERARSSAYSALMATKVRTETLESSARPTSAESARKATPQGTLAERSLLGNEAEERYVDAIKHLKESILKEQYNVRTLQAARASTYSQKSEMEEFFLKCVDESRKDLGRRRHLTMNKAKSEQEKIYEAMLSNEDVLVCLYEKLFPHRSGIARSLGSAQNVVFEEPSSLVAQF